MEKLCKLHSKNSPLADVSQDFLEHHKNPYIKVFERLANSLRAVLDFFPEELGKERHRQPPR